MKITKRANGDLYITRREHGGDSYRDWFLVKHNSRGRSGGEIVLNSVFFPNDLIGRKLRFKIELID